MSPARASNISHMTFMSQVIGSKNVFHEVMPKRVYEAKVAAGCVFLYAPAKQLQL